MCLVIRMLWLIFVGNKFRIIIAHLLIGVSQWHLRTPSGAEKPKNQKIVNRIMVRHRFTFGVKGMPVFFSSLSVNAMKPIKKKNNYHVTTKITDYICSVILNLLFLKLQHNYYFCCSSSYAHLKINVYDVQGGPFI